MASCKILIPLTIAILIVALALDNEVQASPAPCFFMGLGRRHKKNESEPTTPAPQEPKKEIDEATKKFEKNFERFMDFIFGNK